MTEREFEQRLGDLIDSQYPGMGGWFSKLKKKVGSVLKKAIPVISAVSNFIPGVGTAVSIGLKAASLGIQARDAQIDAKKAREEAARQEAAAKAEADRLAAEQAAAQKAAAEAQALADAQAAAQAKAAAEQAAAAKAAADAAAAKAEEEKLRAANAAAQAQAQMEAAKYVQSTVAAAPAGAAISPTNLQHQLVMEVLGSQGVPVDTAEGKQFVADFVDTLNAVRPTAGSPGVEGFGYLGADAPAKKTPKWLLPALGVGAVLYFMNRKR